MNQLEKKVCSLEIHDRLLEKTNEKPLRRYDEQQRLMGRCAGKLVKVLQLILLKLRFATPGLF